MLLQNAWFSGSFFLFVQCNMLFYIIEQEYAFKSKDFFFLSFCFLLLPVYISMLWNLSLIVFFQFVMW